MNRRKDGTPVYCSTVYCHGRCGRPPLPYGQKDSYGRKGEGQAPKSAATRHRRLRNRIAKASRKANR